MTTQMALHPARRFAMVLAVAGAAALGTVATAPAALAAPAAARVDLPVTVMNDKGNGPDAFIITENGRVPIFFCDPEKPNKQHNNCLNLGGPRI
jgi:hypothetical protein